MRTTSIVLQSLFAAITAGTPTSFTERLYAFSSRGPGNVEDRSGEPPNEPPPLTLQNVGGVFRGAKQASNERAMRQLYDEFRYEQLKEMGSQLAQDIGLFDIGPPPSR